MHILFATTDFIDSNGPTTGLPKYLFRTAKILVGWGHEVTVVTCSNRTIRYEFERINICRVRCPEIIRYGIQGKDEMARNLRNGQIIHREIEEISKIKKIDIIQYTSLCGLAYFHDFLIPAVVRLSSYAKMYPTMGTKEEIENRAEIEREAALRCDAVFAPSYVVADQFGRDINRNVDVIETPYLLEVDRIDDSIYKSIFKGKKYVLFYGSIIENKGLQTIVNSVYRILQENEDVYLGLLGDGELSWIFEIMKNAKEYSERIIYHEAVGFSQLIPIIKSAELVILPSLMENFSNACVESMALGQIVLGTQGASFEQLIMDGENGVLCQIGDAENFVDKVNEILTDSESKKKKMQEKARITVERLKPEIVTMQLLEYYKAVIDHYYIREKE